jgi:hypothetical protein
MPNFMRLFLGTVLGLLCFDLHAQGVEETVVENDLGDVRHVVSQQIAAFQNEDSELAFSFASPVIRTQFGSPQNFMRTVKTHYSSIYSTRSFTFGRHVAQDGHVMQEIEFVSAADNSIHLAVYKLIKFKKYGWRITGVELVPKPEKNI